MTGPPARPDVAVLGAGIAGLTIAWRLLRRGAAVTVVAGSQPSASGVAAGMLAPMPEGDINPGIGRLATEALRSYPLFLEELAKDTGLPTGFVRSGLLRVSYSEEEALRIRDRVGAYEAAGMPSRWLDASTALAQAPGLGEAGLQGGLLSYDEAQVQPDWMMSALRDAVVRRGGAFVEAEVLGIQQGADGALIELRAGGVVEELSVAAVVVALGSWSGALPGAAVPVRPVKGQLLIFAGQPGPGPMVYWGHNYLLTKPDASVVLGATMEDAGFSTTVDGKGEDLRSLLGRLWPALAAEPATGRAGLRPAAADGLPVIGWIRPRTVYAFTAHFRNGFLLAPMTASLAANEIVDGVEEDFLRRLRPGRLGVAEGLGSWP
jgi:glycine oxidase